MRPAALLLGLVGLLAACGSSGLGHAADGGLPDAGVDGGANKAALCAATFGSELTAAFGRLDGTILAVVTPADTQCAMPNNDHAVLQVVMRGAAYRMVINVQSAFGPDYRVRFATLEAALPAPAWSEGWHSDVSLDYPSTLGVHPASFTPYEMPALIARIVDEIAIGEPVSVYAHSAHKIHRNGGSADGAIVLRPTSGSPRFLLFHFADQTF
jgi:hypothetical protein